MLVAGLQRAIVVSLLFLFDRLCSDLYRHLDRKRSRPKWCDDSRRHGGRNRHGAEYVAVHDHK